MPRRTSESKPTEGLTPPTPAVPETLPGAPSGAAPQTNATDGPPAVKARALVLTARRALARRIKLALGTDVERTEIARCAIDVVDPGAHDLLIIDASVGHAEAELITAAVRPGVTVIMDDRPTLEATLSWMRLGAADVVTPDEGREALRSRLGEAARRAAALRAQDDETARLKRLCKQMHRAHNEVSEHVGELCTDMMAAYNELNDQMNDSVLATELNGLLRQELDVESVLRTLLEFLLAKIGTTNAAIFLPSSNGDFGLGAYINYDCPRDTAEPLMDQLASIVAPVFEQTTEVQRYTGESELEGPLGDDAHWLGDVAASMVGCHHDGECLAVLLVFRSTARPFDSEHERILQTASRLFAAQLARVIRVHHRHLPEEEWGGFEAEDGDDWGLAA